MRYMLGLGFTCKLYKKFPTIRVFADDTFIDEFTLNEKNVCEVKERGEGMWKIRSAIKTLCTFQIDEKHLNDKISIHIENNDSNYTNGFITKSTVIQLGFHFLIPMHFLEDDFKKLNYLMQKFNDTEKQLPSNIEDVYDGTKVQGWPKGGNGYWNGEEYYTFNNCWIGGSGIMKFKIVKKLNISMFEPIHHAKNEWYVDYEDYFNDPMKNTSKRTFFNVNRGFLLLTQLFLGNTYQIIDPKQLKNNRN